MRGRIALAAGLVTVGLELLALWLWAAAGWATPGYVFMFGPWPMVALLAGVAAQGTAGVILLRRRPENRVGWVITAFAITAGASTVAVAATAADPRAMDSDWLPWVVWAAGAVAFPLSSFLAFLLAFVFPTGRLDWSASRVLITLVAAACVGAGILIGIRPGSLLLFPMIANPLTSSGIDTTPLSRVQATWLTYGPLLLLAGAGLVAGVALLARYAVTTGVERVQVRWYIAAGVVLAVAYAAQLVALATLGPRDPRGELIEIANHLGLGLPPVAMTIAILRYRLYDIDVILSRAFVYGALTAVLAGLYAAGIRLFNAAFSAVTGDTSDLSLVLTTLLLATTFTPIKNRLEKVAARRLGPVPDDRPGAASDSAAFHADPRAPSLPNGATADFTAAWLDAALADRRLAALIDARVEAALAARSRPTQRRRVTAVGRRDPQG